MVQIEVLKFGSSVLRSPGDLRIAVDEIYRRWRAGYRVLAVVSAFEGVTNQLLAEAAEIVGNACDEAVAAYVSTGEQQKRCAPHRQLAYLWLARVRSGCSPRVRSWRAIPRS